MTYLATTGTAGVIDINGTVIVEMLTFLLMLAILARYVYPEVVKIAEARQRAIAEQLTEAERAKEEAEARLEEARRHLDEARQTAQQVVDTANKSGEQVRQDLKQKAEEEARRIGESARNEVASMVVAATQKVIGETLDDPKHHQLIERAIEEVASGNGRG